MNPLARRESPLAQQLAHEQSELAGLITQIKGTLDRILVQTPALGRDRELSDRAAQENKHFSASEIKMQEIQKKISTLQNTLVNEREFIAQNDLATTDDFIKWMRANFVLTQKSVRHEHPYPNPNFCPGSTEQPKLHVGHSAGATPNRHCVNSNGTDAWAYTMYAGYHEDVNYIAQVMGFTRHPKGYFYKK